MSFTHKLSRRLALAFGVVLAVGVGVVACSEDAVAPPEVTLTAERPSTWSLSSAGNVLVGAGNIARCDNDRDEETADVLDGIAGTIFTTGDNVHGGGWMSDYKRCYRDSWGRHLTRTRPSAGELDYARSSGEAYYDYFGSAAGPRGKGYYSYDAGDWHIVVLNSNIDVSAGSAQLQWLVSDLAANPVQCTAAYWHHPRFSSYSTPVRSELKALWDVLYAAGVELVLNGHYRVYERFAPQDPDGAADPAGIRQFTVGTGGHGVDGFGSAQPNSEVREAGTYGVLKLTLESGSYTWEFIPVAGQTFTDSGSGTCHGPGSGGTGGGGGGGGSTEPVASVDVTPATASVTVGQTLQLQAAAHDADGNELTNRAMTWLSRDTSVAKVTATGLVTGMAVGTAFVLATSEGKSDSAKVSVTSIAAASVQVSPASASLSAGESAQLSATVRDANGNVLSGATVAWATNAPSVATVSSTGMVTAAAAGSATITATSSGKSGTSAVSVTAAGIRSGYYAAPNGSSSGDGSYQKPWSLATALSGGNGRVQPGDTIWLRGGNYDGGFTSTLTGTSSRPIVVRQYPGERATLRHSGSASTTFHVRGSWGVYWGFEIMNPDPTRWSSSTSSGQREHGVVNNGSNNKYINLVVHDAGVAFYTYTNMSNIEVYGTIFYNNGWQASNRGHGHALYVKSDVGPVVLRDNIMFNQFGWGVHAYTNSGSGKLNNIHIEGNVAFNNGTLSSNSTGENILLGGADYSTGGTVRNNLTYFSPGEGDRNVRVGYSTYQNGSVVVENNLIVGGGPGLELGYWSNATIRSNTMIGTSTMIRQNNSSTSGLSWSNNVHRRDPNSSSWWYGGSYRTFSGWRSASGLGSSDQASGGTPTSPQIFVRPNAYEPGRATIVVYNWSQQGSILANISGVLNTGDLYEVRNVQDLYGPPVVSGTFGGSIILPLTGVTPPTPVGLSSSASPRTGPDFDVFIVTRK